MTDKKNDYPVNWVEIHAHAKQLGQALKSQGEWKGIIAVTRGGMIPACIVAQELDIRLIETVCLSTYQNYTEQGEANVQKLPNVDNEGEGWIVIDDLVDTGNTYRIIRQMLPKAHFAAVYAKPDGAKTTDTHVIDVPQESWIFLPWEFENPYTQ